MAVIPIDLVTIDEMTNIAPVYEPRPRPDEEATEAEEDEVNAPTAAPAAAEAVIPEAETPLTDEGRRSREEARSEKPAPKAKEEDFQSALQQLWRSQ